MECSPCSGAKFSSDGARVDDATEDLVHLDDRAGNAPMRFAPESGTAFFAPAGWTEAEYRPILDEAVRLKRAPRMAWLWKVLGLLASKKRKEQFKRFSGVVLLHHQS